VNVGEVIRIFVYDTNPPKVKYLLIVGSCSQEIATVFINSDSPAHLPPYLRGVHVPIATHNCPFLQHDSFIDCSDIRDRPKDEINKILQKDPGRNHGSIPRNVLSVVMTTLKNSMTIPTDAKIKYGL
jgi:hypothetical protein